MNGPSIKITAPESKGAGLNEKTRHDQHTNKFRTKEVFTQDYDPYNIKDRLLPLLYYFPTHLVNYENEYLGLANYIVESYNELRVLILENFFTDVEALLKEHTIQRPHDCVKLMKELVLSAFHKIRQMLNQKNYLGSIEHDYELLLLKSEAKLRDYVLVFQYYFPLEQMETRMKSEVQLLKTRHEEDKKRMAELVTENNLVKANSEKLKEYNNYLRQSVNDKEYDIKTLLGDIEAIKDIFSNFNTEQNKSYKSVDQLIEERLKASLATIIRLEPHNFDDIQIGTELYLPDAEGKITRKEHMKARIIEYLKGNLTKKHKAIDPFRATTNILRTVKPNQNDQQQQLPSSNVGSRSQLAIQKFARTQTLSNGSQNNLPSIDKDITPKPPLIKSPIGKDDEIAEKKSETASNSASRQTLTDQTKRHKKGVSFQNFADAVDISKDRTPTKVKTSLANILKNDASRSKKKLFFGEMNISAPSLTELGGGSKISI